MSSYNSPSIQSAENSTSLPSERVSPSVQLFENTYFLLGLLAVTILLTSLYFLLSYCPVTNNIDKLLKTNISKTCRNSFFSLKNNKNQLTSDKQGRSSNNEELYKKEIGIVDSSGTLTVKAINPNNTLIIGKNTLYINPMEGKVGVNTSELISTLTVNGDLSINGLSGEGIRMVVVDENGTLSTKELNNEEIIELTNTNAQYLSLVGDKLTLSEGNTVTLPDKQILSLDGNRLTISGGNSVDLPGVAIQKDNWGEQYVLTDNTIDGKGLGYSRLTIARQGATTGQVLKWNGSTWAPASDEGGTGGGSGTVVSFASGAGLMGGTISTSGTVFLNT